MNAGVRRWTSSWGSSRTGQQVGSGRGGGTGIRSMKCLILAGKQWGKQCKAIKGPQAPSKVSHFCLVETNRWAVVGSGIVLPGPSQRGAMVQCVEYGTGMLELLCSWLLCWLLPGKWRESGHLSHSLSYLLPVLSKNKLGGQGLSLPMHMHSTTGCNLSGA